MNYWNFDAPSNLKTRKMYAGIDVGAEQRVKRAQTREQGPPSAPAEIHTYCEINSCHKKVFFVTREGGRTPIGVGENL